MFEERPLDGDLDAVRETHAPDALVLSCQRDFETLDPAVAEDLALLVESLDPVSYPEEWLPPDAPDELRRYAGSDFTVGMPGDGGVAWTHQTEPPVVFVKPRLTGSPGPFVDFLIAEALVEVGLAVPEQFMGFFEQRYRELAAAIPLSPGDTYQLAVALYTAWVGRQTRPTFAEWPETHPNLGAAWVDAGERLAPRLEDLRTEVARGQTDFAAAAELACSAVKHAAVPEGDADGDAEGTGEPPVTVPDPFAALDTAASGEYGAEYAVEWARKTFEKL
jgi:hypothetical protein